MISDGGINGVDELTAIVTVVIMIQDIQEQPVLDLSPSDPSSLDQTNPTFFIVGEGTVVLFRETVTITDEDIGDSLTELRIKFLNRPNGVQEGIRLNSVSLISTSNVFTISLSGIVDISAELANIHYFNMLASPDTQSRSLEVTAVDSTGQVSQVANMVIELLTIPTFDQQEYFLYVYENDLLPNGIVIAAVVGDGTFTAFVYALSDPGSDHFEISDNGSISVVRELDREGPYGATFSITVMVSLADNSY